MRTPMTAPPQQRSSFWRKAASTIQPPTKSMYYVLLVLCIIPQGRILLPPSAMDPGHLGKPLLARHTIEAEKGHILVSSTHHGSPSRARHLLAPWYRRVRWRQRMYLSGSARSATMVQSVQGGLLPHSSLEYSGASGRYTLSQRTLRVVRERDSISISFYAPQLTPATHPLSLPPWCLTLTWSPAHTCKLRVPPVPVCVRACAVLNGPLRDRFDSREILPGRPVGLDILCLSCSASTSRFDKASIRGLRLSRGHTRRGKERDRMRDSCTSLDKPRADLLVQHSGPSSAAAEPLNTAMHAQ